MHLKRKPVVIISALSWGLGHAARCIPVINEFVQFGAEVILFGSDEVLARWEQNFPELEQIRSNDYEVRYHKDHSAWLKVVTQLTSIKKSEQQAYAHLQSIVKNRHIDIIISDNRYYFRHENIISILLCHQLSPELPKGFSLFKRQFQKRVAHLMNHFDEVWVPDFEAKNSLSGQLSINPFLEIPAIHIGVLSRFDELPASDEKEKHVLIASGPQPQLDILISEFIRIYSSTVTSLTIITSSPYNNKNTLNNVEVLVLSSDEEFAYRIQSASHIISRSGYSSVMDFIALNRTALLIPTPGQTEQEYLAEHLKKFGFSSMKQKDLLTTTSPEGLIKPKKLNLQRDIHKSLSENIKRLINEISQNE